MSARPTTHATSPQIRGLENGRSIVNRLLCMLLVFLFVGGCYRGVVRSPAREVGQPIEDTGATFVYGLVGTTTDAKDCVHGIARAEVFWPWWGGLVNVISFGIVTPVRMMYVCAAPATEAAK